MVEINCCACIINRNIWLYCDVRRQSIMKKFNYYAGIVYSSAFLTFSIILAELYGPFKNLLASIFTHHWIGKVVITALLFIIIGFIYSNKKLSKSQEKLAWNSTLIS